MAEFEACYIYAPNESNGIEQRPSKRRRTDAVHQRASVPQNVFVPLLRGNERRERVRSRLEAYEMIWKPQEVIIKNIVDSTNVAALDKVVSFVESQDSTLRKTDKIPVGLLVAAPGNGVPADFMDSVANRTKDEERTILVKLAAGESTNPRGFLKTINQAAISQGDQLENGDSVEVPRGGRRLNYDLEILQKYVHHLMVRHVMIYFQDSEAFDDDLLSDLIELLSSWLDRIPIVLFFGISTSIELFQEKMTKRVVVHLEGQSFDIECVDVERIFTTTQQGQLDNSISEPKNDYRLIARPRIGPLLTRSMMNRQREGIQSWSTLTKGLKYAYMSHFFANPLSASLVKKSHGALLEVEEDYQAVRNLPSFKRHCERLLYEDDYSTAKLLLDDDEYLGKVYDKNLKVCDATLGGITATVTLLHLIQSELSKDPLLWSEIYAMGMSGQLAGSDLLKDTLLSIQKMASTVAIVLINAIIQRLDLLPHMVPHRATLNSILARLPKAGTSVLRSGYDVQNHNLRTTIVAQRVELSQKAAALTKEEAQYTKNLEELHVLLKAHFEDNLVDPRMMFPIEVLVYDLASPYRDVFTPRPRFAMERALIRPHDYLGHECCEDRDDVSSLRQPAIALLYGLYLECGSQINAADLWSAFWTVANPYGDDEEADKQEALSVFERALAELKYMGMVKHSRKKADHLAKLSWEGL